MHRAPRRATDLPLSFWRCGAEPIFGSALAFSKDMKTTRVYIDGGNLYNGLLKRTPWKWLDLVKFSKSLLQPDHDVTLVRYFTSRVLSDRGNAASVLRQDIYLQAQSVQERVEIVEGFYQNRRVWLPFAGEPCKTCHGKAEVVKTEEKRTDVNLAVSMVTDAQEGLADCYVVISGDADLAAAVGAVRYKQKKPVLVFNPHREICGELKKLASYYKNIDPSILQGCQLPDEVRINERTVVHCPPEWKGLAKLKAKPRSVKESVSKQLDEEMLLASLYLNKRAGCSIPMATALADPELTDLLYQRDLILMSGRLTPAGEEAARRILRKYGILNRLASQG